MGDSEWSRPAGLKLTRENLQSRVKEEDSIIDIKNASEGQSLHASRPSKLCAQAQSVDDMPFRTQAYTEVIRDSQTVSDTILKHELCKLVIAKVRTVITNDDTCGGEGVPNLAKRDFKNLKTTRASLVGNAFASTNFDNVGQTQNVYTGEAYQGGNSYQPQGSGTLPSNTITNPNEDLKGITTQSGAEYQGPTIPTTSFSLPKVVEHETEVTKDMVPPTNNRSTKDVQPPFVQTKTHVPNSKPVVSPIIEPVAGPVSALKPNPKPSIPYPSRLHDQKLRDKANDQKEKFFQIFQDLNFNICFADALILMPKFGPTIKTLLTNKDKLSELARTPLNEHCSAVLLKKLPEKQGDPGKFLIPELTLRVGKEAITFNLDQTSRYSANYDDMTANRIDVIDMACEEYSQEVLGFSDVIASEVDAFLALEDDPTSPKVDHSYFDPEGDILLLEAFINDDPSLPPPTEGNYMPYVRKELKICEAKNDKSSIDEPLEVELKDLPPHLKYAFLEGDDKLPVIIAKDLSDEEKAALIKVLKSHKQAIAWKLSDIKDQEKTTFTCPYETFAYRRMPFGLCNAPGTFQRCMMAIFHDMIEKMMEVFMENFSVFGNSFETCLSHLEKMLKRCKYTNLYLNWEKSHFMVKEGIVLGHNIFKNRIEVDKAKVDVIAKLPHPTTVKGIRSFLGHAGFYR
nr:reverse transcriptase domain-containing protein [Tanacetum cinerariifolium]